MSRWALWWCPKPPSFKPKQTNNMIKLNRPSSCATLYITPANGAVTVEFKGSGATQTFTDVNGGDIENLISDTTVSVGKWVNQVLLGRRVSEINEVTAA
jgi:hypothetical protein